MGTSDPENPYRRRKSSDSSRGAAPVVAAGQDGGPRLDPGQMAQLIVDLRKGAVDREAASALSRPLGDLAQAFAMQAEVLKGVHDAQQKMQEALADDQKSEMMINSTEALNETFRGVRSVQQSLLSELESKGRTERRGRWVYVLIGLFVVALAVFFVSWLEDRRAEDRAEMSAGLSRVQRDVVPRLEGMLADVRGERDRLAHELESARASVAALQEQLTEAAVAQTEEKGDLVALRRAAAESEEQNAELQQRIKNLEGQLADYLSRYEDAQEKVAHLTDNVLAEIEKQGPGWLDQAEKKSAATGVQEPILPGGDLKVVGPNPVPTEPESAEELAKQRAVAEVDRVRRHLNDLLSEHRGSHTYRIDTIGKIQPDRLVDVVLTESAPGRGVVKSIAAGTLKVVVSPQGDMVELGFADGDVRQRTSAGGLGPRTPFYNGRYRMTVWCLNGEKWLAQAYGFLSVE